MRVFLAPALAHPLLSLCAAGARAQLLEYLRVQRGLVFMRHQLLVVVTVWQLVLALRYLVLWILLERGGLRGKLG
jgi:hypothetical protein